MSENTVENKISLLSTKIEKEAKIIRQLIVFCACSIIGINLVIIRVVIGDLPSLLLNAMNEHLVYLHDHGILLDKSSHTQTQPLLGKQNCQMIKPASDGNKTDKVIK